MAVRLKTFTHSILLFTALVQPGFSQAETIKSHAPSADSRTTRERLDRLLFLHTFQPEARDETQVLARDLADELMTYTDEYVLDSLGDPPPYDGSDESLVPLIQLLTSSSFNKAEGDLYYDIPCNILLKRPGLLNALRPQFGGNRDNFLPKSGCRPYTVEGFPAMAIEAFTQVTTKADGHFIDGFEGTLRYTYYAIESMNMARAIVDPTSLPPVSDSKSEPYETWSYLSADSRKLFIEKIRPAYHAALEPLTAFYRLRFGTDAERLARQALFALVWGAECGGGSAPEDHPRTLLINGAPAEAVRAALSKGTAEGDAFSRCATDAGIDPLAHLAAALRPELLADVIGIEGVDAPNGFGKTPLMAAAQANQIEAVRWLIDHGAKVKAATAESNEHTLPQFGRRTALHYAASNAGLPVIEALVKAGADIKAQDDEGITAHGYLNAEGPLLRPNDNLSLSERQLAKALLNPGNLLAPH